MAAPSLALIAASVNPNSMKYLFTDDGTGGGASVTLAQMITDAKTAGPGPSPLAAKLSGLTDATFVLIDESKDLSIYSNIRGNAASGLGVSILPTNGGAGVNSLVVTAKTGTALTAVVEVRFHPTAVN